MAFTIAISKNRTSLKKNLWIQIFIAFFLINWINSYIGNTDTANWILENTLVFLFLGFLTFNYKKFQFSDLSYLLICVYLCLHVYGSKYTYAENPFGYWLKTHSIYLEIITTELCILVLDFYWLTQCVNYF